MEINNSQNIQSDIVSKSYQDITVKKENKELPKAVEKKVVNDVKVIDVEPKIEATSGTTVQFGKDGIEGVNSGINFKVVDKDTGEVIQEFPKRELVKAIKSNISPAKNGLLLDSEG